MKQFDPTLIVVLCVFCNPWEGRVETRRIMAFANDTSKKIDNVTSDEVINLPTRCENRTYCSQTSGDITPNKTHTTISDESEHTGKSRNNSDPVPSTLAFLAIKNTVVNYIGYITVPLFLTTSLTGNSLTLIVMLSKKFWNSPCSLLLIALALSDSTYSIVFPFSKLFVRDFIGYDLRALTEIGCHVFFIIHKTSKMASSWFIVAICIERFIVVWFPLKAKIICSKRNTMFVVLAITIGLLVFNGFWTFSTKIVNGVCIPNHSTPETAIAARVYLMAGSAIFSVIPATILIILTPAICAKLHHQSKMRRRMTSKVTEKNFETSRTNAMLLGITIAYIILVTPTAIAHDVCFTLHINFFESKLPSMIITRAVLQFMEQLNFSINFFLYVLCNSSFRKRVLEVLMCRRTGKDSGSSRLQSNRTTKSTKS